jgi:hypothetical protein
MVGGAARLRRPAFMLAKLSIAAILAFAARNAWAFHSGGAGDCDGCHAMHTSQTGSQVGAFLMQGTDSSSTCLICHGGLNQISQGVLSTSSPLGVPPVNYTPGGDFAWINKSYMWTAPDGLQSSNGDHHGHNVVAADFGLYADATRLAAPGGTYPSSKLACISCHDPHGRYRYTLNGTFATSGKPIMGSGSYGDGTRFLQPTTDVGIGAFRLLAGTGYQPKALDGALAFSRDPPIALAPSTYNASERLSDVRVAYGTGMSEWCGNCHGALHTPAVTSTSPFMHPSGSAAKLGVSSNIYNTYVKSGDLSGTWSTAYSSLVPYEEGISDRPSLAMHARSDGTATMGPTTGQENVMCLSCHRAHASGWDSGLRWNQKSEYVVAAGQWPGMDSVGDAAKAVYAQGRMQAETRAAMYERPPSKFATFQTTLCNKCHAK